jgi:uncharacterized membrane protein YciS (DUF1049 family)
MERIIIDHLWGCLALAFAVGWTLATAFTMIATVSHEEERRQQIKRARKQLEQLGNTSLKQSA